MEREKGHQGLAPVSCPPKGSAAHNRTKYHSQCHPTMLLYTLLPYSALYSALIRMIFTKFLITVPLTGVLHIGTVHSAFQKQCHSQCPHNSLICSTPHNSHSHALITVPPLMSQPALQCLCAVNGHITKGAPNGFFTLDLLLLGPIVCKGLKKGDS